MLKKLSWQDQNTKLYNHTVLYVNDCLICIYFYFPQGKKSQIKKIHKENITVNSLKSPELRKSNCWAIKTSSGERAKQKQVNDLEISSSLGWDSVRFELSAREKKLSWDSDVHAVTTQPTVAQRRRESDRGERKKIRENYKNSHIGEKVVSGLFTKVLIKQIKSKEKERETGRESTIKK